jgi:hypothetical protein
MYARIAPIFAFRFLSPLLQPKYPPLINLRRGPPHQQPFTQVLAARVCEQLLRACTVLALRDRHAILALRPAQVRHGILDRRLRM